MIRWIRTGRRTALGERGWGGTTHGLYTIEVPIFLLSDGSPAGLSRSGNNFPPGRRHNAIDRDLPLGRPKGRLSPCLDWFQGRRHNCGGDRPSVFLILRCRVGWRTIPNPKDTMPEVPRYLMDDTREDCERLGRQARMWSRVLAEVLATLKVGDGWRCLELGCGTGVGLEQIARRVGAAGEVLGVDINPRPIEYAREALRRSGFQNARFMAQDIESLELEPGVFDLVYARIFLYHMPDHEAVFRKMTHWVRPGGLVLVQDYDCSALRHIPALPCYARYQELFERAVGLCGAHFTIGRDLVRMFTDAGLEGIEARGDVHVSVSGDPYYEIPADILDNMRTVILGQGVCREEELDRTVAEMRAASGVAGHCLLHPLLVSVCARRPARS